jgi:hypothetical protein
MGENDRRPRISGDTWKRVEQIVEQYGDRPAAAYDQREAIGVVVKVAERQLQAEAAKRVEHTDSVLGVESPQTVQESNTQSSNGRGGFKF